MRSTRLLSCLSNGRRPGSACPNGFFTCLFPPKPTGRSKAFHSQGALRDRRTKSSCSSLSATVRSTFSTTPHFFNRSHKGPVRILLFFSHTSTATNMVLMVPILGILTNKFRQSHEITHPSMAWKTIPFRRRLRAFLGASIVKMSLYSFSYGFSYG